MKLLLDIQVDAPDTRIDYRDKIMMIGSCFTEHIGDRLLDLKFSVLQNPNGILFDPFSVAFSLTSYIENRKYTAEDLFFYNELWQSWQHHSRYSGTDLEQTLTGINASRQAAHNFLREAQWLIITLGSSFSYRLRENARPVANCHRAPANCFDKHLMTIEEIIVEMDTCLYRLLQFNPNLRIVFTVSPVRHIRDGVVENNRSKARLLEAVHHLTHKFGNIYYFPAYELVIDVLRDYRFYDIDLVHPNYQATEYVINEFVKAYMNSEAETLSKEVARIVAAKKHRPSQPSTLAHKNFLKLHADLARNLMNSHPFLALQEELRYFETAKS